ALRSVQLVHDYREDASVKATGKWKATLATLAIASSVALATEASATGVSNSNEGNANVNQHNATETRQGSISNTGFNASGSWVKGRNWSDQWADGSANDGNIFSSDSAGDTAGNIGGDASN